MQVLESEFEPHKGETLDIGFTLTLEELTGVAVQSRLPNVLFGLG